MPLIHRDCGLTEEEVVTEVINKISTLTPDLVVVGNLHWARWPLAIIGRLQESAIPTVAYLHDCHWLTGRCAYTGECRQYLTGCSASCPTPTEYPSIEVQYIESAWAARRRIFSGEHPMPLFANSKWMRETALLAFSGQAVVKFSPLGLDTNLFSPIDRALARRLLGLPQDRLLVVAGAVDLRELRKGGALLEYVIDNIHRHTSAQVVTFGARSEQFEGVTSFGIIEDERLMPLIYNAADVMIHTAQEESFGQTLMEASACGLPVICIAAGGMVEIAQHGKNAINVAQNDPAAYFEAVRSLLNNHELRIQMGTEGRALVEDTYSLSSQYDFWKNNLLSLR